MSIALGAMAKPELMLLVTADTGDTECLDLLLKLSLDRNKGESGTDIFTKVRIDDKTG